MRRDLIIGLDLGTTAVKAVAVDEQEQAASAARRRVETSTSRDGRTTQEGRRYRDAVEAALGEMAQRIAPDRLAGLCLSGAMHSVMPIGQDNQPLAEAMLWADGRGRPQAQAIRREVDAAAMHRRTGCPVRWLYHPARLRWWREEADLPDQPRLFASLKDWTLFHLTDRWCCDAGLASCTGLLNLHTRTWDDEALHAAGVRPSQLPELIAPTEVCGEVSSHAAGRTGLPEGLPIIIGSSDGALANLGAVGGREDQAVVTLGTSGAVRLNTAAPTVDGAEATWCYLLADELYVRGGAINNGGLAAQWVADRWFGDVPADQRHQRMDEEAAQAPAGCDGLTMLPYFTGERTPLWDPRARASLHGLTLSHTRGHVARAAMEAAAFCLADVCEALELGGRGSRTARLTGGVTRSELRRQIIADALGVRLEVSREADASPIGATRLARRALGTQPNLAAFGPLPRDLTVEPDPAGAAAIKRARERFRGLRPDPNAAKVVRNRPSTQ